jgi:hypothetical protein
MSTQHKEMVVSGQDMVPKVSHNENPMTLPFYPKNDDLSMAGLRKQMVTFQFPRSIHPGYWRNPRNPFPTPRTLPHSKRPNPVIHFSTTEYSPTSTGPKNPEENQVCRGF